MRYEDAWYVRFEVLTVVPMESTTFWDVMLCCKADVHHCFRGTYGLHCQGNTASQTRHQEAENSIRLCVVTTHNTVRFKMHGKMGPRLEDTVTKYFEA
jgi:hypothetical protein